MSQRQGLIGLLRRRPPDEAFRTPGFGTPPVEPSYQNLLQTMPLREAALRRRVRDSTGAQARVEKLRDSPRIQGIIDGQMGREKFTKDQAFYVDKSIYPFLTCQDCIYFLSGNRCVVVSEKNGSGEINPEGTSTGFNASPARLGTIERAYGRGERRRGILPQIVRSKLMPLGKSIIYPEPGKGGLMQGLRRSGLMRMLEEIRINELRKR